MKKMSDPNNARLLTVFFPVFLCPSLLFFHYLKPLPVANVRKYFLQQPRCRDYIHEIIHKINMIDKVFHGAGIPPVQRMFWRDG
ncbi:hypothetical protein LNP25_16995 [Klebsiella variicola subsp. variicola]|nr:hypothetical protein [Klebsiella variicola subsp. variicola]